MLDMRVIRSNPDVVRKAMAKRGTEVPLDELLELDSQRRSLLADLEQKKAERNAVSERIGHMRKAREDASQLISEMRLLSDKIKDGDEELRRLDQRIQEILLILPNIPHESLPVGKDETQNEEVRRWGTPRDFGFEPKPHWDLGVDLGIIDFERAGKVTGARFA
ncbi:MAG: serine--tRNA ligase, partial [Firmicutes bacterium]|nr:serine--tRNA ligase [Bacillota bacterium]